MAENVTCQCRGNCGIHDGDCRKPVEKPLPIAQVVNGKIEPWYESGLCEKYWNALKAAGKTAP